MCPKTPPQTLLTQISGFFSHIKLPICDWIWQTWLRFVRRYGNRCVVASQSQGYANKISTNYSSIFVWVYKFLTPKFSLVFKWVIISQVRVASGQYRSTKLRRKTNGIQRPFMVLLCTPNWLRSLLASSLWSPSSLYIIPTKPWPLNGANCSLVALTGLGEKLKQTHHSSRKYRVQNELCGVIYEQRYYTHSNTQQAICVVPLQDRLTWKFCSSNIC